MLHGTEVLSHHLWSKRVEGLPGRRELLVVIMLCLNLSAAILSRIGRSGRYGRKGVAINFVKNDDIRILRDIEQYYSTQIDEMPMNGSSSSTHTQPAVAGCSTINTALCLPLQWLTSSDLVTSQPRPFMLSFYWLPSCFPVLPVQVTSVFCK